LLWRIYPTFALLAWLRALWRLWSFYGWYPRGKSRDDAPVLTVSFSLLIELMLEAVDTASELLY